MEDFVVKFSSALGWSILHTLWFGFIIYVSVLCLFYVLPRLTSSAKSYISLAGSFSLFCFFIVRFLKDFLTRNAEITMQLSDKILLYPSNFVSTGENHFSIEPYLPIIVVVYILGVLFEGVKLIKSYFNLNKIKSIGISAVPSAWLSLLDDLKMKMGIKRQVTFRISSFVEVPMVIGYLKPFVFFPIAAVNRLDIEQVEAILIHELTHVKRNDYLLNFLKVFVETLLFFNPFVWLLGNLIERGREYACDDSVIKLNIQPKIYANALLNLELLRKKDQQLAMAAFSSKSELFNRIKRLTTMKTNYINRKHKLIAISVGIIGIAAIAWVQPHTQSPQEYLEKTTFSYLPDYPVTVFSHKVTPVLKDETNFIKTVFTDTARKSMREDIIQVSSQDSAMAYLQSPEWKSKVTELEKNLQSLSETTKELAAQFNSEEWQAKIKAQVEAGQLLSKEWEEKLNTPEWKEKMENIQASIAKISLKMTNELVEKFDSLELQKKLKQQVEESKRISEELESKFNSKEQ